MPLSGHMTSRNMALNLRKHIPIHIRRRAFSKTERQDLKRTRARDALVNKDELIASAQETEAHLLQFEA